MKKQVKSAVVKGLSLSLFIMLVSKTDADVSKTSVWLAYWGAPSKKSSAFGRCLCTCEYIILFFNFLKFVFLQFRMTGLKNLKPDMISSVVL